VKEGRRKEGRRKATTTTQRSLYFFIINGEKKKNAIRKKEERQIERERKGEETTDRFAGKSVVYELHACLVAFDCRAAW
jgi:hypothetical protein